MRYIILSILLVCAIHAAAATHRISGLLSDTTGAPLAGASVSLLYPEDSTLAFFSISNDQGIFEIGAVNEGSYVLQVALMGYYSEYRVVTVAPGGNDKLGALVLHSSGSGMLLNEVVISGEKVPVRVKGDTLEYNAGSYKVKPDAMVEDLLRKLPGVQVDQEGNIKSMGKAVTKVLVDGKEFFGDDPKTATRNLPADAVDKVQAFEKKSDRTLFTGVDDGAREQTLNLKLKAGHKSGYFGEARGGLGFPERYDASLRAFKFREKSQLSALGMFNNINKFGFSFEDLINFNGGISNLMRGGGRIDMDAGDMPVDFGQPVTGRVNSGALGFNYSVEPSAGYRWNVSYMGTGAQKLLEQISSSRNLVGAGEFRKEDASDADQRTLNNRLATSWRSETDSVLLTTFGGYARLGSNTSEEALRSRAYSDAMLQNNLYNTTRINGHSFEAGGHASWTRKMKDRRTVLEGRLEGSYSRKMERSRWNNLLQYPVAGTELSDAQYQDNEQRKTYVLASVAPVLHAGKGYYVEPSLSAAFDRDERNREQGLLAEMPDRTDSLSPYYYRNVFRLSPAVKFRRSLKSVRWHLGLEQANLWLSPFLNRASNGQRAYHYLLPSVSWQQDIASGSRLTAGYTTTVTAPSAIQLLPATDYSNPLLRTRGNPLLSPEYMHTLDLNYNRFDQFNMSSFFLMVSGSYTRDKIDWSRTVMPDLSQQLQSINTPYALTARLNTQYARPVRKLGLQASAGINETWNRSISPVNGINNTGNTWTHELEASLNNLNSNKWDVRLGGNIRITDARYSINGELNNTYYSYTLNGSAGYYPAERWHIGFSADLTRYTARNFDNAVTIPLLKAELSRYLFARKRGTLTLSGFDLLNRNKAVQRISQLNYQLEQRSNIIGRYVMLSFAYKLNKTGGQGGIRIGGR